VSRSILSMMFKHVSMQLFMCMLESVLFMMVVAAPGSVLLWMFVLANPVKAGALVRLLDFLRRQGFGCKGDARTSQT
jgi:hypothetical protein